MFNYTVWITHQFQISVKEKIVKLRSSSQVRTRSGPEGPRTKDKDPDLVYLIFIIFSHLCCWDRQHIQSVTLVHLSPLISQVSCRILKWIMIELIYLTLIYNSKAWQGSYYKDCEKLCGYFMQNFCSNLYLVSK